MAEARAEMDAVSHPAPHRGRAEASALAFGLAAAPLAWVLQLVIGYGVASHVCFPADNPVTGVPPDLDTVWWVLLAVELIAGVIALAGAATAYGSWRATREEASGEAHHMIEAGEGRTRFLALWGLMTSFGFLGAIVFSLVGLFAVPLCGS
jgi:hypothetical protein